MKHFSLLLITFLITGLFTLTAQNGTVAGKVVDEVTGETLIGVAVMVKGTGKGVSTDIDGTYKLQLAPGTYALQVSYISYQTKVLEGIVVKPNEVVDLDIVMKSSSTDLGEIVISTNVNKETSTALVLEQKNSVVLFDGISTEQIRRTSDRNTADVLRRVSGATIQDNSFVIIRGLPDRYNAAFINGAPLPSSEPDRKAFSFDIFPSALLNDLKVIKTAMPSLPGEFAGGIIQVRTKDIPEKNYYNLSLGASFDFRTTFGDFRSSLGGATDFFGLDDGTRQLPSSFPTNQQLVNTQNNFQKDSLVLFAKMLRNNFPVHNTIAAPGANFQYSMGHNINLVPKAKRENADHKSEFGSVFALTYTSRVTYREVERNDFDDLGRILNYNDQTYNTNTSWGALWNLAFMHSKNNGANTRISLKNLFNVNTNDLMVYREGADIANGFDVRSYNMYYSQNTLFSTQLSGEHVLPKSKIKFEWGAGYSRLSRIIPDYRTVEYRRSQGDTTQPFAVPFSTVVQGDKAGRFFSTQLDNSISGTFDFSLPIKIGATRHELKTGVYLQYRDREFGARQLGYASYKSTAADIPAISQYGIDSLFIDRNFSNQGLLVKEVTRQSDTYGAVQSLIAGYLQLEHGFFQNKLKIVWGARLESFRQQLNTFAYATGNPINLDSNVIDVLPSINIIYGINEKMNLRLSGSQTVSRPESRELAPFAFYDYNLFALVTGNPGLKRTKITNADLRYEFYPVGGQLISASAFFKWFENPIEKVLVPAGSMRLFTYYNVPSAYAFGFELEYRFTIGSFIKASHSRVLDDLSFTGNFAYIQSEVNLDSITGVSERRPLQGQSPYIVNAGIAYNDSKYNFGINWVVNYVGPRIFTVGNEVYGSIWENPRLIMDLQLTKTFFKKKLEIRVNFSDLLAPTALYFQDMNGNRVYDEGVDNRMIARKMGQQMSFSLGYKF